MLIERTDAWAEQAELDFDDPRGRDRHRLIRVMDEVNDRWERGLVKLVSGARDDGPPTRRSTRRGERRARRWGRCARRSRHAGSRPPWLAHEPRLTR